MMMMVLLVLMMIMAILLIMTMLMILTYRDFLFIRYQNIILISCFSGVQTRIKFANVLLNMFAFTAKQMDRVLSCKFIQLYVNSPISVEVFNLRDVNNSDPKSCHVVGLQEWLTSVPRCIRHVLLLIKPFVLWCSRCHHR